MVEILLDDVDVDTDGDGVGADGGAKTVIIRADDFVFHLFSYFI